MNENDRSLSVNIDVLLAQLRALIADARQEAKRTVDVIQVRTCWEIGRHIVEFEQGGQARAAYGKKLLSRLAESLTGEFGKGFDDRNLRNMRAFYQVFPIWHAVRTELSWTHYRALLRVTSWIENALCYWSRQRSIKRMEATMSKAAKRSFHEELVPQSMDDGFIKGGSMKKWIR